MKEITEFIVTNRDTIGFFFLILALNTLSSTIGTIKSILVVKQMGKATYAAVFIDALVYSLVLKSFSSSGFTAVAAYCFGHLLGTILGEHIEQKIALGLNDITIYVGSEEKMLRIQAVLLEKGFSTTAYKGDIHDETKRYTVEVQIQRKDFPLLIEILKENGIDNPTMMIKEVKAVSGKLKERLKK